MPPEGRPGKRSHPPCAPVLHRSCRRRFRGACGAPCAGAASPEPGRQSRPQHDGMRCDLRSSSLRDAFSPAQCWVCRPSLAQPKADKETAAKSKPASKPSTRRTSSPTRRRSRGRSSRPPRRTLPRRPRPKRNRRRRAPQPQQPSRLPSPHRPRAAARRRAPRLRRPSTPPATTRPSPQVRDYALSGDDADRIREAVEAVSAGGMTKAKALRDQVRDAVGRKLIDWYIYRDRLWHRGGGARVPGREPGLARPRAADPARRGGPVRERRRPGRGQGLLRPVAAGHRGGPGGARRGAGRRQGRDDAPRRWPPSCGSNTTFPSRYEADIVKRIGSLLTEADHKRRLDRLLMSDSRWAERAQRARGHHPAHHRPAFGAREEEGRGAARRVPAHEELAPADRQAAAGGAGQGMGPRLPEGAGPAPPEQGRGGLEDPAGRAGADACRSGPTAGGRSGAPTPTRR